MITVGYFNEKLHFYQQNKSQKITHIDTQTALKVDSTKITPKIKAKKYSQN